MFDQRAKIGPHDAVSIRRDAWRAQLLQEQVADEAARRRRAAALRAAVALGVVLGLIGSVAISL